ncbi:MAG TPA: hypothetical protein VKB38_09115 [Terracidiphilus sp.]|nr:hypothetical protein [Terracidiphilus sp.]
MSASVLFIAEVLLRDGDVNAFAGHRWYDILGLILGSGGWAVFLIKTFFDIQKERRAKSAEIRAEKAEERAQKADSRAEGAETRAADQFKVAEQRAEAAENRADAAETRASDQFRTAERRAEAAERRAIAAESRAANQNRVVQAQLLEPHLTKFRQSELLGKYEEILDLHANPGKPIDKQRAHELRGYAGQLEKIGALLLLDLVTPELVYKLFGKEIIITRDTAQLWRDEKKKADGTLHYWQTFDELVQVMRDEQRAIEAQIPLEPGETS